MRWFNEEGDSRWRHGEKYVMEPATGKRFVLTQPNRLFDEDTYGAKRALACEIVPVDVVPERTFYVYEFAYMPDGYSLRMCVVSEDAALEVISANLKDFLHGRANDAIQKFFEER